MTSLRLKTFAPLILCLACTATTPGSPATPRRSYGEPDIPSLSAAWYKPNTTHDEFEQTTTTRLQWLSTDMAGYATPSCTGSHGLVEGTISRWIKASDTTFLLAMSYRGTDWIFVKDEGLVFLADSTRVGFDVDTPRREVLSGAAVAEISAVSISRDQIKTLTTAGVLKGRIAGSRGNCDFVVPALSMALLRKFSADYAGMR